ncbi:alanine:cation symporter family protein, partial [Corynebacterium diphtheriae]
MAYGAVATTGAAWGLEGTRLADGLRGPAFVQTGFDAMFSGFGPTFVAVALAFFAFTTIVAYYYMAEVNIVFLTRNLRNGMVRRVALRFLQALILVSWPTAPSPPRVRPGAS